MSSQEDIGQSYLYPQRSRLIQALCPVPKRHLQELILKLKLRTGLDIGCGAGSPLSSLRGQAFVTTGIDISEDVVERARGANSHDHYIVGDVLKTTFHRQYDVVVLSHVIEHLDRDVGFEMLRRIEQLSRCLVYVETPNGFLEQQDFDGNPYQRHLSGWFAHDFEGRGYTVFGQGIRGFTGPMGEPKFLPQFATRTVNRAAQRIVFRHPAIAQYIGAIRYVDDRRNVRAL